MKNTILAILIIFVVAEFAAAQRPPLTVTVEPMEAGSVVYSPTSSSLANDGPTGQIALLLRITNRARRRDLRLTKVSIGWQGPNVHNSKDITNDGFLPLVLPRLGTVFWNQVRDANHNSMVYILRDQVPTVITINLFCEGYSQPFLIIKELKKHSSPVAGGSYLFPGKQSDLGPGEYWITASNHGTSSYGSQLFAYDMGMWGWNDTSKSYTETTPGTGGCSNTDFRVYGKPLYAMADGFVVRGKNDVDQNPMPWRHFGDTNPACPTKAERDAWNCDLIPAGTGGGNFIQIRSADELHSYAHMQKGYPDSNLLIPGTPIKAGQFLGLVGNAGCWTQPHVHIDVLQIHNLRQVMIDTENNHPDNVSLRPLIFHDIWVVQASHILGRDPKPELWAKVDDRAMPREYSFIWASNTKPCYYNPGISEIAMHGVAEADYQEVYNRAVDCGYRPVWVDGFEVNDKNYYNPIFRYDPNRDGLSNHKQDFDHFDATRKEMEGKGYRLIFIDSYPQRAKGYFSSIYVRDGGPQTKVTANLLHQDHEKALDRMTGDGWTPIQVSAYTIGPLRYITTLYEKRPVGRSMLKSYLSEREYNELVVKNEKEHMALVNVNAYLEVGFIPRYAAIWHKNTPYTSISAPHSMSATDYQTEYNRHSGLGMSTLAVTGYERDNHMRFEAIWVK